MRRRDQTKTKEATTQVSEPPAATDTTIKFKELEVEGGGRDGEAEGERRADKDGEVVKLLIEKERSETGRERAVERVEDKAGLRKFSLKVSIESAKIKILTIKRVATSFC